MTLLTGNPIKFGAMVDWLDDKLHIAVCENAKGEVVYAGVNRARVIRPPRSWEDRKREHPHGR